MKENNVLKKENKGLKFLIDYVRNHFWSWFIYIITTSLVLLVVCSLIFDKSLELSTINNWVGVILGLVALVATVFSLGLSFYNYDQQNELNKQNEVILQKILSATQETKERLVQYQNNQNLIRTNAQIRNSENNDNDLDNLSRELSRKLNNNKGEDNEY